MVVCLSFSTAGANIALLGFIMCSLLSQKLWQEIGQVLHNSYVKSSLLLFFLLILSAIWSEANSAVQFQWVSKYKKLLVIPLAITFFYERVHKQLFLKAVFASLLGGLSISYFNFFGLTSIGDCPYAGCSTHSYITLSMLNCLLFLMASVFLFTKQDLRFKLFFLSVAICTALNVAWVLQSRTGQLMLLVLVVSMSCATWIICKPWLNKSRNFVLLGSLACIFILITGVFFNQGSRLSHSLKKISEHKEAALTSTDSAVSVDVRFEFYRKTLGLISERPLLGWGAGGHEPELKRLSELGVTDNERFVFANPHNEYLTWAVQTGLLGLACFLFWLFTVWRHAFKIEDPAHKLIMLGWLLIFTLGNFLNSFLLDFSEGYMTVLLIAVLMPFQSQRPCSTEKK
jgi:O-antigen ligase